MGAIGSLTLLRMVGKAPWKDLAPHVVLMVAAAAEMYYLMV